MKLALWTTLAALFISAALPSLAADTTTAGEGKGKYLVMVKHTPEECLARMDEVAKDKKLLGKAEWGCMSGDHTMYLTTEAKSSEDALSKVPEAERKDAKAVKLTKLTEAQIRKFHEAPGGK
ncbi:hypothetical protein [Anaeromyxobacter terrae]|uniref:hypothetical protein n=1 Tax=Anaeromyxobacter terrae TaxID=2925406 RepID=UPI001F56617D|nr:hypothetical protein [Anaeromyxobacter sp. SG22]